jgi:hypothetical protein
MGLAYRNPKADLDAASKNETKKETNVDARRPVYRIFDRIMHLKPGLPVDSNVPVSSPQNPAPKRSAASWL